jgi:phosphopantetheinyl transferase
MPLILKQNIDSCTTIGVWKIDETETELWEGLLLSEADKNEILSLPLAKRRLERIACRKVLSSLLIRNEIIIEYGNNGEPLMNGFYVSFSHSGEMIAVAISEQNPVGIDIERIQDKIVALRSKFVSENELTLEEIKNREAITRIWTAKEAVYKLFSGATPDFKAQIFVKSDQAEVFLHDKIHSVKLFHWKIEEYQCTLCIME